MATKKNNPFMPGETVPQAAAPVNAAMPMPTQGGANVAADAFEVDLTNVSDSYMIDEGAYRMRCIEIEQSVSQSGNPMFIWTFAIVEGKYAGREFKMWTAITPAAMWKVAEAVQALGIGNTGSVVKFKRSDVLNRECGGIIETQEYNGNDRSTLAKLVNLQDLAAINSKK